MLTAWKELKRGAGCSLCSPRSEFDKRHHLVRKLRASALYLNRGQWFLGTCALIFESRHVTQISELSAEEWTQFALDIWETEGALRRTFSPDHLNVECLGNVVPHLHIWLIPRYLDDGRWGHPIWTTDEDGRDKRLYTDEQLAVMAEQIRGAFDSRG